MSNREYFINWRKKQKEAGLCKECTDPIEAPSTTFCLKHSVMGRQKKKNLDQKRRKAGLCRCGRARDGSNKNCRICLDRNIRVCLSVKLEVLSHYSGGSLRCACCGEQELGFLTLDHIAQNGAKHRQITGGAGGKTYPKLRAAGYPPGYRVLCWNCNAASYINAKSGICPHTLLVEQEPTYARKYRANLKKKLFATYGDRCYCCGETDPSFLTMDHINNDGSGHTKGRRNLYLLLKEEGFPPGIVKTACFNCNCGRAANGGICPHVKTLASANVNDTINPA